MLPLLADDVHLLSYSGQIVARRYTVNHFEGDNDYSIETHHAIVFFHTLCKTAAVSD